MTPEQRIAAILHSRGREVLPSEVKGWMVKFCSTAERRFGKYLTEEQLASMIERGVKVPTMVLHLKFGDALD